MKSKTLLVTVAVATLLSVRLSQADVLELKNGTVLNGKYVGGTATTVRFEVNGETQVVETSQIIALTFTTSSASTSAAPAAAPAAPPKPPAANITLPAGTTLLVRVMDSVSSKDKAGTTFKTKLEYDLGTDAGVALKGGTDVIGKVQSSTQAKRARGQSTLDVRLYQIVINGKQIPITTTGYQEAGQKAIAKAAKGAAAGAAIGAIAGDAGKGAAIGATAGAVIKGQTVTIPPGALLTFDLSNPVTIPAQ